MHNINYVSPQINNILNQEISIQVSLDGFSFSVYDANKKNCLAFRNYCFSNILLEDELIRKVEEIIFKDNLLQNEYKNSEVIFISQKVTLVPKEYFNQEYMKKYFEFNHNLEELDELHFTYLEAIEAFSVFSLPNYLTNTFYNHFLNTKFKNECGTIINYGNKISVHNENTIIVALNAGFFDIAVFAGKNLLLYNSFQYTNTLDFIYFFLYTCRQLKLSSDSAIVHYMGEAPKDMASILVELKNNVKRIVPAEISPEIECKNLTTEQSIKYYSLFIKD